MLKEYRLSQIFQGLSSIAQKVYAATPIQEAWPVNAISQELLRLGIRIDRVTISGCLSHMVRIGIITEIGRGHFMREPVAKVVVAEKINQSPPEVIETQEKVAMATKPQESKSLEKTPIGILAPIAAEMRSLSARLDEAALAIEAMMADRSADGEKLRQLQSILMGVPK